MKNFPYEGLELIQGRRFIAGHFLLPHLVISTCRAHGGIRSDIEYVFNQQACEPSGFCGELSLVSYQNPEQYLAAACEQYQLPFEKSAMLSTAANMHCAGIHSEQFEELTVCAIVTGGIEGNAGRAGDPASYFEQNGTAKNIKPNHYADPNSQGTINTMVFINKELSHGALVRSIMMAAEAKTSVLQELSVASRFSPSLATGTGTDQIAVCCRKTENERPLTNAGKHSKLGELIAKTIRAATKETLLRQNGLSPVYCCSSEYMLRRFGVQEFSLSEHLKHYLTKNFYEICQKNIRCIDHDPITVAAVAGFLHIADQCSWDILPSFLHKDIFMHHAAMISCSVSLRYDLLPQFKSALENHYQTTWTPSDYCICAIALGYMEKWKKTE